MSSADFEQLRMLARWSGDDPESLAVATAETLVSFGRDPAGLLVACRRLVAHHPDTAPLWWLAARVLSTDDPTREAAVCAGELELDPTTRRLLDALPFPSGAPIELIGGSETLSRALRERPDLEVLDPPLSPTGPGEASHRVAEVLACDGTRVALVSHEAMALDRDPPAPNTWLVVRLARHLPGTLFDALVRASLHGGTGVSVLPLSVADAVVGARSVGSPELALGRPRCGAPPELLRALA